MRKPDGFGTALIIAVFLLSWKCSYAGPALSRVFDNHRDSFSIALPEGWAPMSPEKLEAANKLAQEQHPGWKRPTLHYAYQMTNAAGLAFAPYILIRVGDKGGVPDPKAVRDEIEKDDMISGVYMEQPFFDVRLNAFMTTYKATIPGMPPLQASVAFFLTSESVIKVFVNFPQADSEKLAGSVQQIINNVQIADWAKFKLPAPPSRTGLVVALVAIGVIVIVLSRAKPAVSQ